MIYHAAGTPASRTTSISVTLGATGEARVGEIEHLTAVAARQERRPPVLALGELEALERVPRVGMERRDASEAGA